MAPVRSAYAGGYSEAVRRQLENVVIPDKVKCESCKKDRMQSAFSKRQLEALRNAIFVHGAQATTGPSYAKCRNCVGGQTVELTCCICDQVKGLESFAKAQRQNRDMARCLDCVQSHIETDPVLDETKLLEDEGEPPIAYDPTAIARLPVSAGRVAIFSSGNSAPLQLRTGRLRPEPDQIEENSTGKKKSRVFTNYNNQGTAHRRRISIPQSETRSVHTGWESSGVVAGTSSSISGASKKPMSPTPKKEPKFARVPAYKPSAERQVAVMRTPEPVRETAPSDDEDANEAIEDYL